MRVNRYLDAKHAFSFRTIYYTRRMNKTRNKKRSRRKSQKMTGGEDPAVLLKDDNTKLDKSEWDTLQNILKNLYQ
jgi:hypothetical protein